ncbi:MAG: hypothetical protein ACN4GR_09960 [Arenicellales bacterium]
MSRTETLTGTCQAGYWKIALTNLLTLRRVFKQVIAHDQAGDQQSTDEGDLFRIHVLMLNR